MVLFLWLKVQWTKLELLLTKQELEELVNKHQAVQRLWAEQDRARTSKDAIRAGRTFFKETWQAGWITKLHIIGRGVLLLAIPIAAFVVFRLLVK